jgi:ABC-2 type transport system ATP-binding protein
MTDIAIEVRNLEKTYLTFKKDAGFSGALRSFFKRETIPVRAVKPTSFVIKKGEFVGLLGPNGAGKTTMLKMMTGLIPPSKGQCLAFDQFDTSTRPKKYLRRIGMVMGQRNQLHPDLPAIDSFKLSQAIYDITDERFKHRLQTCLNLFEIKEKLNIPVRKLSLGERMKMELILAILHEPELLFLDEPTIGLDFNAARQIREFLAEANQKFGITTILTSHYTKDIEELCRRVILVNHGTTIYDGPLHGLDERIQGERLFTLSLASDLQYKTILDWVSGNPDLNKMESESPDPLTLTFSATVRHAPEITRKIVELIPSSGLRDMIISERSLEDVFSEIYRRNPDAPRNS